MRRGYKETEIGEIPVEWEVKTLGELTDISRGASPRPINDPKWFANNGPGWIRIEDVTRSDFYLRSTKQYLSEEGANCSVRVHPGDLIMSICGTIGRPVIIGIEACIHDGFVLFRKLSSDLYQNYLYYTIQNLVEFFDSQGQPGTQKNLNTGIVKSTLLPLPPLPEQKKIAAILSSVDDAIRSTQAVIDQARTLKKGLLGQLLTRGIGHKKFKQTEIGEIPVEWEVKTLGEICERIMDGTHFSPKTKSGPRPYLTSKNIRMGYIDLSNLSFISEEEHREIYQKCPVLPDDILLTKDGANTGNCAINSLEYPFSLLSSVAVLRPKSHIITGSFLYQCIASDAGQKSIVGAVAGQAITRITLEKINRFIMPFPPLPEQKQIAEILSGVDAVIRQNSDQVEQLKRTKSGLMQDLLTGRKRVAV